MMAALLWWPMAGGGALGAAQKSVGYLSGLNHNEKSIPFFLRSSVGGPIRSKSCPPQTTLRTKPVHERHKQYAKLFTTNKPVHEQVRWKQEQSDRRP
jgi:hypothetical protein